MLLSRMVISKIKDVDIMTHKNSKQVYCTDFDRLERSNYKGLTKFAKEIVDRMVELSTGTKPTIVPEVQAKIDLVMEGFKELTDRQKRVLELAFGLGDNPVMSEQEIADELGITQTGAHRLKKRALNALSRRVILDESVVKNIKNEKNL